MILIIAEVMMMLLLHSLSFRGLFYRGNEFTICMSIVTVSKFCYFFVAPEIEFGILSTGYNV